MLLRSVFVFSLLALLSASSIAQNTRITDRNKVGWWAGFATLKLNDKWGIHTEYQWRRENFVTEQQQSLLRLGLNYQLTSKVLLRAGYGWIETFDYGDYPINRYGKDFTEHRTFQMATLSDKLGRLDISHRFMFEQRWIGRYSSPELTREDEFFFVNRLRYMFRMQCPLMGQTLDDKELYAVAYDEIFIGFGKNVNENVFDQNRIGLLLGYRFHKTIRIEGGFLHQTLQLPREITLPDSPNGRNVYQYNSGFIVNTLVNLDCSRKK